MQDGNGLHATRQHHPSRLKFGHKRTTWALVVHESISRAVRGLEVCHVHRLLDDKPLHERRAFKCAPFLKLLLVGYLDAACPYIPQAWNSSLTVQLKILAPL